MSGPEIDGVSTYVFRRSDVDSLDMKAVIDTPYVSPAGRKKKTERLALDTFLSRRQAVAALNLHSRQLRIVVKDGWIAPLAISALHWRFKTDDVAALAEKLRTEYRSLDDARQATGQSLAEFRRTWIFTGYAAERRFGNQRLISVADLERIVEVWKESATSSAIGKGLSRARWLCPNLEKMSLMQPTEVLGRGHNVVRLYSRSADCLRKYDLTRSKRNHSSSEQQHT